MKISPVPCAVFLAAVSLGFGRIATADEVEIPAPDEVDCGEYGTSVVFATSTAAAARQAVAEEKLLFILHVSGHFEDSDFT